MVCTQLYSSTAVQLFVTVSSLGTMVVWLLKIKKEHKGAWIISARSIRVPYPPIKQGGNRTRVETAQDHQTWTTQQENFKKKLGKYGKSRILIARQHFSMLFLWRQLHKDFLRFVNWSRPSGRWGNFYQFAQRQHQLLCALSSAESLSCPKSIGSIPMYV